MKILIAMLLVAAPAAAQAMGMHGGMGGCGGAGAGIHLAVGLYALLAALGYWVLQHSAKETAGYVKKAGLALGWVLIVTGLLGVLCGMFSHARRGMSSKDCRRPGSEMMEPGKMGTMPMVHPDCPMPDEMMKKPEAVPKKK